MTKSALLKLNVVPCTFIERLNRFVALVDVNGETRKALVTNTGRLEEFMVPGRRAFCTPKRGGKTDFVLVAFEDLGGRGAIIDTRTQARAFERAVELGLVPWLRDCRIERKEVTVGKSRLDYLFGCPGGKIYAEMKSAVLRGGERGEYAMYPDCPSVRGRRHIRELIELSKAGERAMIFFIGAMPGVERFRPYSQGDPEIARLLAEAQKAGVEIHALSLALLPDGRIVLERPSLYIELEEDF
ncbi:DNA/RNA nuclease SfsA [Thermococcus sp. M36]|uniref:DNA/RNA nuclease SfsA n=1 Tax=Thermococcus sp. M36 TaxID=1638261 RepID=UPI00143A21E5|nr:DNA/RNA nuclease SfsA [Thermococcus sp. M36]NJE05434.1 DNA/RNA nuclease SfsA [Thermococcus sp. M36]